MKRSHQKLQWYLVAIPIIVLLAIYLFFHFLYPSQSSDIFAITPANVSYGDTVISGKVQKDSPPGTKGRFLLILPDTRPVVLDSQGLDYLIGQTVTISGILSPSPVSDMPMTMIVNEIQLISPN